MCDAVTAAPPPDLPLRPGHQPADVRAMHHPQLGSWRDPLDDADVLTMLREQTPPEECCTGRSDVAVPPFQRRARLV
jgi:hypothetical protein